MNREELGIKARNYLCSVLSYGNKANPFEELLEATKEEWRTVGDFILSLLSPRDARIAELGAMLKSAQRDTHDLLDKLGFNTGLARRVYELEAEVVELKELLKEVSRCNDPQHGGFDSCPFCGGIAKHEEDCKLIRALYGKEVFHAT